MVEQEQDNLVKRAASAMVQLRALLDFPVLCWTALRRDQSDASPPHPCTVVGHEGTGI